MVNTCVVLGCRSGYASESAKVSSFKFPFHILELNKKWIKFVNRKDWFPTQNSVICSCHFEDKFIITCTKRKKLNWKLNPIPTIYETKGMRKILSHFQFHHHLPLHDFKTA